MKTTKSPTGSHIQRSKLKKKSASSHANSLMDVLDHENEKFGVIQKVKSDVPNLGSAYGIHPRRFVFDGHVGSVSVQRLPSSSCPFTGLSRAVARSQRQSWKPDTSRRAAVPHRALVSGPAWEQPTHEIIAAISKPSAKRKKFLKKRVGCAAKRMEQLDRVGETLGPEECTMFRALAARCMHLSLDRPDTTLSAKELCREFADPGKSRIVKLKRVVRYSALYPRLVWSFNFGDQGAHLDVFSDTDFGGCLRTRRSTSGGAARIGDHVIKTWSKTQSTVALSSAEAELTGICQSASEGLGLQAICCDLGLSLPLRVHSDAAAAIGICRRRGLGRVRHLAIADLWVQDRVRARDFTLHKVAGQENVADLLTKYLPRADHDKPVKDLGLLVEEGRAASATNISEAVMACRLSSFYVPDMNDGMKANDYMNANMNEDAESNCEEAHEALSPTCPACVRQGNAPSSGGQGQGQGQRTGTRPSGARMPQQRAHPL